MENLIELGVIEVVVLFCSYVVGKNLFIVFMMDDVMEDYIVIMIEYYWYWDLKGIGLNVWDYCKIMEKMMNKGGFMWFVIDDLEISFYFVNCLMVRIGRRVF